MRLFILLANAGEAALWLAATIVSRTPGYQFDAASLHGIFLFLVIPAFVLGVVGRWLPAGLVLTCISLFMVFSVAVVSQIAS